MASHKRAISFEFKQLVAQQHQQLRSFVRTLGVDPDWVDDLAQEAFLVAWRESDSFDCQRDIGKWLRGIARNLVRNELRKGPAAEANSARTDCLSLLVRSPEVRNGSGGLGTDCQMSALRDCVERLPPKSRQIVAGRYGDGWKAPDLADHLGMTAAAVRQALMRIREQLKQCIEFRMAEG